MSDYTDGAGIFFPWTGNRYVITKVDRAAGTVTFAPRFDLADETEEAIADLESVDAQVLP
ncbi:hypothetical protein MOQ72_37345 [Saccharopolyspora sp. K220]|uniref:hypothetical protein n=1 Tax=Saccharopolyspora soli TaxID=2926618 RepID=UPI001F585233|nr:hypothetical protein [Saccharopolyspora soli]MCI2423099.1 hypothetical protein [Saccharopolyspora soli]